MSNVTLKNYHIICLEYRQEREDEDYGSCLWARFYFNLDKYELMILSDCGNYGYEWAEAQKTKSFLQLMLRCDKSYILKKIARKDVFDFRATKESLYINAFMNADDETREKLNEIFDAFEYEPETGSDFIRMFDEENDGTFVDTFEMPVYRYPYGAVRIVEIFDKHIRPKIKSLIKRTDGNIIE